MINIFKRKSKQERAKEILDNLVYELKKVYVSDERIIKRLKELNVPEEYIENHFQLNAITEVKTMPKETKEQDYEEENEEELDEESDEEQDEAQENEEEQEKPKKKAKKEVKEEPKITVEQVLQNHEARLRDIEAAIFRLKSI